MKILTKKIQWSRNKKGDKLMWHEREIKGEKKEKKKRSPRIYLYSIFYTPDTVRKISMR